VRAVFTPDAEWLAPAGNATALALDGTHHLVGGERIVRFLTSEFGTVFVADVSMDTRRGAEWFAAPRADAGGAGQLD
jgi:uncharacterized protein